MISECNWNGKYYENIFFTLPKKKGFKEIAININELEKTIFLI